jgi:SOS-response transcriptional repressor LexA
VDGGASAAARAQEAVWWEGEEARVRRPYREEGNGVRLGPKNDDREELVLAGEGVGIEGCVAFAWGGA